MRLGGPVGLGSAHSCQIRHGQDLVGSGFGNDLRGASFSRHAADITPL